MVWAARSVRRAPARLLHRLRDAEEMEREMAALALSAAGSAAVPALRRLDHQRLSY